MILGANVVVAGKFRLVRELGRGGMASVWVAHHLSLDVPCAIKFIQSPEDAQDLGRRFEREAKAAARLRSSNVVQILDHGVWEGLPYIVMELLEGESLGDRLDRVGSINATETATIVTQVARALSKAHAVGIVHRDLKPDNVLIEKRSDGSESAKVLDFGVASLAGRAEGLSVDARPLTQAGTILGTPGYMSPEQASAGDVDHRTDLYALGVMLWELCRGERLFDGENITQIFAKQFKTLPPALDLGLSPSGRELSALVASLLAWDKNARPASAAIVRDTLRRIAEMPESRLSKMPVLGRIPLRELKAKLIARAPWLAPWLERVLPYRRIIAAGVVVLALLAFFVARSSKGPEPTLAPEAEPTLAAEPQPAEERGVDRRNAQPEPEPEPEAPREELAPETELERAPAATAPERGAGHRVPTPSVFIKPAETLLHSRNRSARQSVAKRLLRSTGVPSWLLSTAELELASRCSDKKEWLDKMRQDGDPRVLPALERMADQPKHGCPPFRLADCLSCLRRDLDTTLDLLNRAP